MSVRAPFSGQQHAGTSSLTHTLTFDAATGWSAPFPDLDSQRTLIVVFAECENADQWQPIEELIEAYPESKIVGCSSNTVLSDGRMLESTVSVGMIKFRETELRTAFADIESFDDSCAAGVKIAAELFDADLKGVLLFADGQTSDATALVRGLQELLPPEVTIAGGLSGGVIEGGHVAPWVLCKGRMTPMSVCAIGLIGSTVDVVPATGGGWNQIGKECLNTRSHHRTLFELDGLPAADVYRDCVSQSGVDGCDFSAINYPIAVKTEGLEMQIVRDIYEIDEVNKSLILAGDIPDDAIVRVMNCNDEDILDGVDEVVDRLRNKTILPTSNALCICVSCMGRKLVLGKSITEEARLSHELLGAGISQVGFYAFGEISTTSDGASHVHNQTLTMILIREF
jgi:hypothetical protein